MFRLRWFETRRYQTDRLISHCLPALRPAACKPVLSPQLQEEHQKTLLQEEKEEQYLGWAKMAVVPVLLVVAGAIFAYMVFTRKPQEEQPETEKLVGDKQAEEHV